LNGDLDRDNTYYDPAADYDSSLLIVGWGKAWIMNSYEVDPYEVTLPQALGCGALGALTALHVGATPEQAVAAVIKYEVNCGGKIHVLRVPQHANSKSKRKRTKK